ncbi:hypothetical protein DDZ18_07535 [Marinicauda salina]|uniref:Uncharacterized protein n=1 Tax=Marinicauda salina TaxID=2135793 RepID=A0A2U2BU58_9PROT|nr:hypothetical protein [Marinicauda salina]PWE17514.1 hypothetical protein DDZ18_07535 [Marinicauda salina]
MDALLVSAVAAASAAGPAETVELIEIGAEARLHRTAALAENRSGRCSERRSASAGREMLVIRDADTGEIVSRIDPRDHGEAMGRILERVLDEASTS